MKKKGFTLIELLAVIVIIGVLVGLLAPALLQARRNARKEKMKTDWKTIAAVAWAYRHEYGRWPCGNSPASSGDQVVNQADFRNHLDDEGDENNPRRVKFINWSDYEVDASGNITDPVGHQPYVLLVNFGEDKLWVSNNWEVIYDDE